jgi:hypothetical protein
MFHHYSSMAIRWFYEQHPTNSDILETSMFGTIWQFINKYGIQLCFKNIDKKQICSYLVKTWSNCAHFFQEREGIGEGKQKTLKFFATWEFVVGSKVIFIKSLILLWSFS